MVVTNLDSGILLPGVESLGITNPVEKLDMMIRESYKAINKAIQDKKIHPYSDKILGIKATFANIERALVDFDRDVLFGKLKNPDMILDKKISIFNEYNQAIFTFKVHEHETSEMKRMLKEFSFGLEARYKELCRIEEEALNDIKLYDLTSQNILKRGEILKRASIVVPENTEEGRAYNVLEINLNGSTSIVHERKVHSADYINECIDRELLQTVAMARNSEKYPYEETSRDTVLTQYEALCMIQH